MTVRDAALDSLSSAYTKGDLTLYLGAGVSVGSGLPTWDKLVLAMYFSALNKQSLGNWHLPPNYLFAIAEWHLEQAQEPLEITARKIRRYYEDDEDFLQHLWETLYAGFLDTYAGSFIGREDSAIHTGNETLDAVSRLCKENVPGKKGVKSVITYNYDSLLEIALGDYPFQSIDRAEPLKQGRLPIYHVHGYVPLDVAKSAAHNIVFTEEQYHQSAKDAYSWANLVQIQCLSSSTGLMIGLSLADRNMRRLCDAVSQMPVATMNYALLQEPQWKQPDSVELQQIDERARLYFHRFETGNARMNNDQKPGINSRMWQGQIIDIIKEVQRVGVEQQTFILEQLGIRPIWYRKHSEISDIIAAISKK